jgi:glycosyltransferase involved in cell wall biosynthesis
MQVINLLKFRGALDDCRVVPFINRPQIEVASILGESLVFLSFGYPEGFGLPAAEAMASGCVVVGFHGGGGREFFRTDFCYPIAQGDIVGFAKTVEAVLQEHSRDPIAVTSMGRRAADFIRSEYSPALEEAELLEFWSTLLSRFDS